RRKGGWRLRGLYDDASAASVETQRPIPHLLYMGASPGESGGRDEEDRPVLWSSPGHADVDALGIKLFFAAMHLPTLSGEERPAAGLNDPQRFIAKELLKLSGGAETPDDLGSELRA